jgi:hypothetical protein
MSAERRSVISFDSDPHYHAQLLAKIQSDACSMAPAT